jgi:hypothetical protein
MTDWMYVEFRGGPKDGEVWRAPVSEKWIPKVGWIPKHQKTRHCYKLREEKGEWVYAYERVDERSPEDD